MSLETAAPDMTVPDRMDVVLTLEKNPKGDRQRFHQRLVEHEPAYSEMADSFLRTLALRFFRGEYINVCRMPLRLN